MLPFPQKEWKMGFVQLWPVSRQGYGRVYCEEPGSLGACESGGVKEEGQGETQNEDGMGTE